MALLSELLVQSQRVEILDGSLVVTPPIKELEAVEHDLLKEISSITGLDLFLYRNHSTGTYGRGYEGLTLQFENLRQELQSPHAIFNVNLKRARTTKNGKKGTKLPKGRFRITKRTELYKFWKRCRLDEPPRLSAFCDYIGNLRRVILIGDYSKGERLDCKSLTPANISHDELLRSAGISHTANNLRTTDKQQTNKPPTIMTNKESPQNLTLQRLEPKQSTGAKRYGYKYIREHGNKGEQCQYVSKEKKRPQEQSTDEWLADWDQVGMDAMR